MNEELRQLKQHPHRIITLLIALSGLAAVFMFQQFDILAFFCGCAANSWWHFIVNKTVRVLLNDLLMLLIIHEWFRQSRITHLAFWIQIIDVLVLLPVYFVIKLSLEGDSEISSPLLSQFHRLIVNPTLMILIFPAIYFQQLSRKV